MSNLAKELKAKMTGNKIAIDEYIPCLSVDISNRRDMVRVRDEYNISVKFEKTFYIDSVLQNPNELEIRNEIFKQMKRAIIEEVFGEFRPLIIQMNTALYDRDTTRLATLLSQLERQMFVEYV